MKNNLSALARTGATASIILLGFCLVLTLGGCSTSPSSVERYFFDTATNTVATVTITTNTVGGVTHLATQTNIAQEVIWTIKPTVTSVTNIGASIVDQIFPGIGKLMLILTTGFLGIFGFNRQRKLNDALNETNELSGRNETLTTVSESFAQSIEMLREILKTTPQGQALDVKIVDMLHRNQVSVGIIREAVAIVENTVSNAAAKSAASKILSLLPPTPQPAS